MPEYENPRPDPDDLNALKWGREHYIKYFPRNFLKGEADKVCATHVTSAPSPLHMKPITIYQNIYYTSGEEDGGTGTCA